LARRLKNDPAVETLGRDQQPPPSACKFATSNLLVLAGNDTLSGGAGDDNLVGGAVNDVLMGGDRADRFEFDMSLSSSSIDIAWCGGGV
jgi:Ca2+-binding RTX toxin-like protein